ncbi:hypothetical protein NA56DRAFT_573885 [Hyaloscypha hepaticicola]|uniref:DUF7729 domain-containing protein n=1 Tax=Hyaloscypha hepaticicola TaxID=2082293 RepID=A0A2J6Q273_9HELO|nr:hypothetical protein NA56DRAFT_573885 [Hyaloscypha hepaticicola]
MVEAQDDGSEVWGSGSATELADLGTLLVDPAWTPERLQAIHGDLHRRNDHASNSISSTLTVSTTATTTVASSSITAAATPLATSQLPNPLDIGFSNNITASCQSFMTSMLTSSNFTACLPFSLLLQNSNSFFQVEKSVTRVTQTLDYTCGVDFPTCSARMANFAKNITTDAGCKQDLASENPLITYAYLGLMAYQPLYRASCLKNPSTAAYCFADAITNYNNSADSYIYFLPLNISLVGGSQPTCTSCLKETMNVFEAATSDRSSALASDYVSAAMQVNVNCGPSFVNSSLAAATSGAQISQPLSNAGIFALVFLVASWLL